MEWSRFKVPVKVFNKNNNDSFSDTAPSQTTKVKKVTENVCKDYENHEMK